MDGAAQGELKAVAAERCGMAGRHRREISQWQRDVNHRQTIGLQAAKSADSTTGSHQTGNVCYVCGAYMGGISRQLPKGTSLRLFKEAALNMCLHQDTMHGNCSATPPHACESASSPDALPSLSPSNRLRMWRTRAVE